MSTVNLYDVLDVSNDATPSELKKAYRMLVKEYHPDKPTGDAEMFELISHAYNILSNEESRGEYDTLYKLSEQSKKDHGSLKSQAENYFKVQETTTVKKSKKEQDIDFKKAMSELDRKHNYKRNKDADKIDPEQAKRRLDDLAFAREQDDIELTHDELFDDGRFDINKFNAAWDVMHQGPNELIPHSGNPNAWTGFGDNDSSFSSINNYDDLYVDDSEHVGIEKQNFSSANFDIGIKKKISKKDIEKLKVASYTSNHNKIDESYNKSLEEKLKERQLEDLKYEKREMQDFNTDPTCGGYGIFKDLGIKAGALEWDNDEDDIRKKYERLIELRNKN